MNWQILTRLIAPALLFLGGIASIYCGSRHHRVEVIEVQEVTREIKIPVPAPPPGFGPPGFGPGGGGPASPDDPTAPDGPPSEGTPGNGGTADPQADPAEGNSGDSASVAYITQKVTVDEQVAKTLLEPALYHELTIGGVALVRADEAEAFDMPAGSLRQTYSGQPPALCPT